MGFMDQNAGGGGPPLMRWNGQEGKYLKHDSDTEFNDECFVLNPAGAVAGYLKFGAKGERPVRRTGPIYPEDEAPLIAPRLAIPTRVSGRREDSPVNQRTHGPRWLNYRCGTRRRVKSSFSPANPRRLSVLPRTCSRSSGEYRLGTIR